MYENDSKQSLPAKEYRELLGSALCVFSSNNGFRITSKHGEQVFATKTLKKDGNIQFEITVEYLQDFIKRNETLSDLLHEYRGY